MKKITVLFILFSILLAGTASAACYRPIINACRCVPCNPCRYFCPRTNFTVAKYQATFFDPISNRIYPGRVTVEPAEFLDLHREN